MSDKGKNYYLLGDRTNATKINSTSKHFLTGELKATLSGWTDPALPGFKVFIEWNKRSGLFADEQYVDSALGYFKRIGDEVRYMLLKHFISEFQTLLRDYDFLFQSVEGIGDAIGTKPTVFVQNSDDFKLSFTLKETIDYRVASLFTYYKDIWYDSTRGVEVLPSNLRKFNMFVLVFQNGFYSDELYAIKPTSTPDNVEFPDFDNEEDVQNHRELFILPTLTKLQRLDENFKSMHYFKNFLFYFGSCEINQFESVKSLFSEITNEPGVDPAKVQITFNYKYFDYYQRGATSNAMAIDIADLTSMLSAMNTKKNKKKFLKAFADKIKKANPIKKETAKNQLNSFKSYGLSVANRAKNSIVKGSPLGDILSNPEELINKASRAVQGLIEDKLQTHFFSHISKLNNFILSLNEDMVIDLVRSGIEGKKEKPTNLETFQKTNESENDNVSASLFGTPPKNPEFSDSINDYANEEVPNKLKTDVTMRTVSTLDKFKKDGF